MKNFTRQISVLLILSCLLGAKLLAQPTMSAPTVSTITHNSATLGGFIAGSGITARGTSWKISSPVVASDNQLAEGGTAIGAYTHSRTSLPSGTKIFFVAYGTDGVGTAISSESSFFTLSSPPSGQPASLTATVVSGSQIDLAWPTVTADGFLIYRLNGGTAPNVSSIANAANPPATLGDGSTLIFTATGAATSYSNNTGLSPGTQYSYTIVPFGYNNINPETFNFLIASANTASATTPNSTSTITLVGGTTTTAIDYTLFPTVGTLTTGGSANSASLGRFIINDLGGDGQPTTLTSVTLSVANFSNLSQIAIFDDSGGLPLGQQTVSGPTVTFSGLTTVTTSNGNSDNSGRFRIRATFLPMVTDNQQINIAITNVTALASGSGFAGANAGGANTPSTNDIEVTATQLVFTPASLPNTNAAANFAPLTIRALDALNNVDFDETGTVSLSITTGTGTLSATPSASGALVAGVRTWTNLSINTAGAKVLTAAYSGLPDPTINITILSNGVDVTPGTAPSMCYNGDFQNFTTSIVLAEDDQADFGVGANRTYSMILPTNFIFDTSITTAPIVSGGSDISNPSTLTYVGNNIVRFSYTITGTANTNTITIGGLKVKYIGNTPSSGNILRLGGSAIQVGNADTDGKNHGTLTAAASATVIDFTVKEFAGQPGVNPGETRFSINTIGVKLLPAVGTPIGGIFSGNGVSFSTTQNSYVFIPSAVGSGNGYQITYSVADPNPPGCTLTVTKPFDVYSTTITNLNSSYCSNSPASGVMSVTQAQINTAFSFYVGLGEPAGSFVFEEFVYYDYSSFAYLPIPAPNNIFDPKALQYQGSILNFGRVYIYAKAKNTRVGSPYFNQSFFAIGQFPTVNAAPALSISVQGSVTNNFCANDVGNYTLLGTPSPGATDSFSGLGVTNPSGNNWNFRPSTVPGGALDAPFNITYNYQDQLTGCSNTTTVPIIVYSNPTTIPSSDITVLGIQTTTTLACAGQNPPKFDAKTVSGTLYKWYADAALSIQVGSLNSYSPTVNINTPGSTPFYVTRVINACPSNPTLLTATISAPAAVSAGIDKVICAANDMIMSAFGASFSGASTAYWTTNGLGDFLDNADIPIPFSGPNSFQIGVALKYRPSPSDPSNLKFLLTTTDPDGSGPCTSSVSAVNLTISAGATVNAGVPLTQCADRPVNLSGSSSVAVDTWSIVSGGVGILVTPTSSSTEYTPTAVELLNGASIVFKLTTVDPDGSGPCLPASSNVAVTINAAPPAIFTAPPACVGVSLTLSGPTTSGIALWGWTFGDGSTASGQSVSHTYTTANLFPVQLKIIGTNGCTTLSAPQSINVGLNPIPTFNFYSVCNGDFTEFEAASTNIPIEQYKWDFSDGDILGSNFIQGAPDQTLLPVGNPHSGRTIGTFLMPKHKYAANVGGASNDYTVKLTVFTNIGCQGTIQKTVRIIKKLIPTPTAIYDMATNNGGDGFWSIEPNISNSSWAFNDLNKNIINATAKGWVTNPDKNINSGKYNNNEQSSVNSPCFDLGTYDKPAISLNYWLDTQVDIDGAVLQSSINGGRNWQNVGGFLGNFSTGDEWYNKQALGGGNPGGQNLVAWSRASDNIISTPSVGKHSLSSLPFKTNTIRFRMAFGSNNVIEREGVAFNNFIITERNRFMLVENFTNEMSPKLNNNNLGFTGFSSTEVVKIQYNASFPGNDAVNLLNPSDHNARTAFYGLTNSSNNIPLGYIDGLSGGDFTGNWFTSSAQLRSLSSSPFSIQINNPTTTTNAIAAQVSITSLEAIPLRKMAVFVAIVEKQTGSYQFVMRKLLPSASGTTLTTPIAKSTTIDLPIMKWEVGGSIDPTKLAIIAFIQDLDASAQGRKEVLQSAILSNPINLPTVITAIDDPSSLLSFYPIPADNTLEVKITEKAKSFVPLVVYDAIGKEVTTSGINEGQQTKTLNTAEWAGGVYIIQLETAQGTVRKKVMVAH